MSRIAIPPAAGSRIRWGHPLGRGLVVCVPFLEGSGEPLEYVSRTLATIQGTPTGWIDDAHGRGFQFDAEGDGLTWAAHERWLFDEGMTILAVAESETGHTLGVDQNLANIGNSTKASGMLFIDSTVTRVRGAFRNEADTAWRAVYKSASATLGEFKTYVCRHSSRIASSNYDVLSDRKIHVSWTQADDHYHTVALPLNIGRGRAAAERHWPGRIYCVLIWDRWLTDAELANAQADPYAMLREAWPFFALSSSGPTTYQGTGTAAVAVGLSCSSSVTKPGAGSAAVSAGVSVSSSKTSPGAGTAAGAIALSCSSSVSRPGAGTASIVASLSGDGTTDAEGSGDPTMTIGLSATSSKTSPGTGTASIVAGSSASSTKSSPGSGTAAVVAGASGAGTRSAPGSGAAALEMGLEVSTGASVVWVTLELELGPLAVESTDLANPNVELDVGLALLETELSDAPGG